MIEEEESSEGVLAGQEEEALAASKANGHNNNNDDAVYNPSKKQSQVTVQEAIEAIGMGPFQNRMLWATGLCMAADSMEILLLTFLAVVLKVEWGLKDEEMSLITSSVFLGSMIGAITLGSLADVVGRKSIFSFTAFVVALFGFLTGLTNDLTTLVLVRFLAGFGIGGVTVAFDALAELVPTAHRGRHLVWVSAFWCFGVAITPVVAWLTLGNTRRGAGPLLGENLSIESWRLFVMICSIPSFIAFLFGICFVPETPRWLIKKGRADDALRILRRIAVTNGKDATEILPDGITLLDEEQKPANCCHLMNRQWRRASFLMWTTAAGYAFSYYGILQATTMIFSSVTEMTADAAGKYTFDYAGLFASSSSEIITTIFALAIVGSYGRITIATGSFIVAGLSTLGLCLIAEYSSTYRGALMILSFLARGGQHMGIIVLKVAWAEILSTEIRTTGHGMANAVGRLGAAASPFLVNSALSYSTMGGVLLTTCSITGIAACMLPETKDKHLDEAVHRDDTLADDLQWQVSEIM